MGNSIDYDHNMIFNPEGKIKQVEFLKQTIGLGNTCLALHNDQYGVLIAHLPPRSKLAEQQNKVFPIGENALFAFSGITNDGLAIVDYLRLNLVKEDVLKDRSIHYIDVFDDLCLHAARQALTQETRLYGAAGLLLMDYDGIKLVEFDPSGMVYELHGGSIGHRSQSCETILVDECGRFESAGYEELVTIGLRALMNAHPEASDVSAADVCIYLLEKGECSRKLDAHDFM